ncbi:lysosome membrane protein 2-like [Protopterus annectens]|uniref:lysosome membrane protein 2-like n=1 Tax=Protopterus annectens TaxID=7888 RepID=UPI001CFC0C3E|nr:lysosome membrane protein 2-like [Protopterus annectens]
MPTSDIGTAEEDMADPKFIGTERTTQEEASERSGAPVRVAKRLQISIKAEAVENVTQTGKIRTMILPVIYLIERATIDSETAKMIKSQLLLMEFTENASYLFLSVGLLLAIVAFILAIVTRQKKKHQAANDTSRSKEKHTPDNNYESMHSF